MYYIIIIRSSTEVCPTTILTVSVDKLREFQHKYGYHMGQYSTLAGTHETALKEMNARTHEDQRLTHYN